MPGVGPDNPAQFWRDLSGISSGSPDKANNHGTGETDPAQRKMSKGSKLVTYGIYRDSGRSQPWGSTQGTNTASGTGSGTGQNFTAYGRVPVQTSPSPGNYADTVVTTITY